FLPLPTLPCTRPTALAPPPSAPASAHVPAGSRPPWHAHCLASLPATATCKPRPDPPSRLRRLRSRRPNFLAPRRNSVRRLCDTISPPPPDPSPRLRLCRSRRPHHFAPRRDFVRPPCDTISLPPCDRSRRLHPCRSRRLNYIAPRRDFVRRLCEAISPPPPDPSPRPRLCRSSGPDC